MNRNPEMKEILTLSRIKGTRGAHALSKGLCDYVGPPCSGFGDFWYQKTPDCSQLFSDLHMSGDEKT
jgi:hypothetical protein